MDSSPQSERRQCMGLTRSGVRCRRDALPGIDYCDISHGKVWTPLRSPEVEAETIADAARAVLESWSLSWQPNVYRDFTDQLLDRLGLDRTASLTKPRISTVAGPLDDSTGTETQPVEVEAEPVQGDELDEALKALEWYGEEVLTYAITQANEPRSAAHGDKGKRARSVLPGLRSAIARLRSTVGEPVGWVVVHHREGGEYSIHTRVVYTRARAEAKAAERNRGGNPHGSYYSAHPVGSTVREDGEIREAVEEDRDLNNAGALAFFFSDFYRPEYDSRKATWEKVTEDEIEEAAIEAALVGWKAMHDELDAEDRALASTDTTEGGA